MIKWLFVIMLGTLGVVFLNITLGANSILLNVLGTLVTFVCLIIIILLVVEAYQEKTQKLTDLPLR